MTRWVKDPGPGQMRGEGDWIRFEGTDEDWKWLRDSKFLPTREQGDQPKPEEM